MPAFSCNSILCRYGEIATKGMNRSQFERMLMEGIHRQLKDITPFKAVREPGRIFLRPKPEHGAEFSVEDVRCLPERAAKVFGLISVSPALRTEPDLAAIEEAVEKHFPQVYEKYAVAAGESACVRYAMRARRGSSDFPMSSHDIELHFAHKLLPRYPRLKVDLKNPELLVQVEVRKQAAYVSFANIPGPGGLPSGSAGRALCLLSGGIDSPAAAYSVMRRGAPLDFITFHSAPYTPEETVTKVACLARLLNTYQKPGNLYCINLLSAQKEIRDRCNPRYRTILYRRLMVRIACRIARRKNIRGLVTGDNLGQVASQTMENLHVVSQASELPIHRPLLGNDKYETVALARSIGTYDVSCRETPDSCTVFAPERPLTMADLGKVEAQEEPLDIEALMAACLGESQVMNPETEERSCLDECGYGRL